jgi:pyruvate/2-oxoglutarate dehydrogenase complex dihydrolipoamide acyltransferase (E2) component
MDMDSGVTVEQKLTHSLSADEYDTLTGYKEGQAGREVAQPKLVHLSNSLKDNEFWDPSELKLWANVPGFTEANLVTSNGKVMSAKLKSGQIWTLDDVKIYQDAYPECVAANKYPWQAVNCAFKKTGKMSVAITLSDAVKLDPASLKMVYPAIKEKPAPYEAKGPTPQEVKAAQVKADLDQAEKTAKEAAESSQAARQLAAQRALDLANQHVAATEKEAAEAAAVMAQQEAQTAAAKAAAEAQAAESFGKGSKP